MKKKFENMERKGLPGGPNEMFSYVTGMFSTEGYNSDSPDKNNPANLIASGSITMENVEFPVMGMDNLGNSKMMMPGNNYEFPGDMVLEIPMAQEGGILSKLKNKISEGINRYSDAIDKFKNEYEGKTFMGYTVKNIEGFDDFELHKDGKKDDKMTGLVTRNIFDGYNLYKDYEEDGLGAINFENIKDAGGILFDVLKTYPKEISTEILSRLSPFKKGGSVSWKWKGKTYSGTLIPSMEDAKNRYARTKNGKIKTLPKANEGGDPPVEGPKPRTRRDIYRDINNLNQQIRDTDAELDQFRQNIGTIYQGFQQASDENLSDEERQTQIDTLLTNSTINPNLFNVNSSSSQGRIVGLDSVPKVTRDWLGRIGGYGCTTYGCGLLRQAGAVTEEGNPFPMISGNSQLNSMIERDEGGLQMKLMDPGFTDLKAGDRIVSNYSTSGGDGDAHTMIFTGEYDESGSPLMMENRGGFVPGGVSIRSLEDIKGYRDTSNPESGLRVTRYNLGRDKLQSELDKLKEEYMAAEEEKVLSVPMLEVSPINITPIEQQLKGNNLVIPINATQRLKPKQFAGEISGDVLLRQVFAESSLDPDAVSPAGARGIAQFMPNTEKELQRLNLVTNEFNPLDPSQARNAQEAYMNYLSERPYLAKGTPEIQLAKVLYAYNRGPNAAKRNLSQLKNSYDIYNSLDWLEGINAESRNYINKILGKDEKFSKEYENILLDSTKSDIIKLYKKFGGDVDLKRIYKNFLDGTYDGTGNEKRAKDIYDKLNRMYYREAKSAGMSMPNYVMTYVIGNS